MKAQQPAQVALQLFYISLTFKMGSCLMMDDVSDFILCTDLEILWLKQDSHLPALYSMTDFYSLITFLLKWLRLGTMDIEWTEQKWLHMNRFNLKLFKCISNYK